MFKTYRIDALARVAATQAVVDKFKLAEEHDWRWWVDGVPVIPELFDLAMGVKKVYPFLTFKVGPKLAIAGRPAVNLPSVLLEVLSELWVCMEASAYAVAKIGCGAYRLKGQDTLFMVSARGIENEKFDSGRVQYHMRTTTLLKSAIKNAVSNLVPYNVIEAAVIEYGPIQDASYNIGRDKAGKLPALLGKVTHSVLLGEIRALHSAGVMFTTPEFKEVVANMEDAIELANGERSKRVDAVMVYFVKRSGAMVAECAHVDNIRGTSYAQPAEGITTHAIDKVPAFIEEKVSVLQTLDNGSHVDGIGMKVNDSLYWVEK